MYSTDDQEITKWQKGWQEKTKNTPDGKYLLWKNLEGKEAGFQNLGMFTAPSENFENFV